jgi:two-component system vancomycin resistance associated response regulator VraR
MDIMLAEDPAGIRLTQEVSQMSSARVIMLTSMSDKRFIIDAFQAGAVDYHLKSEVEGIPDAIRAAYAKKSPISAAAADQ